MTDKNIYQRINAVQSEIGYVQKDKAVSTGGGSYNAASHDKVTALLRQHMIKEGIALAVTCVSSEFDQKEDGSKQRLLRAEYHIAFINIDKPDDRLVVTYVSHALDNGDKAPGKAVSYATKYALLKTFLLETGEDEESRYQQEEYDFAEALTRAESSPKELAREILKEAKSKAVALKDSASLKAVNSVGNKLAAKFAAEEAANKAAATEAA